MLKAVRTMLIIILNIIFYGLVVFGGWQICQAGYGFAYDVLGDTMAELPPGQDKTFAVTENQSDLDVAGNLAAMGLIKGKYTFFLRMKLEESDQMQIQPGIYQLNSSMTYEEVIQKLCR